ncbi:MAG: FMN-binding negative transcriptional regulator [Comamonadaceae bacterium]|nr:MAG: FMN-binding negative transcriptional regulator [Comamonadaceae bacterium]
MHIQPLFAMPDRTACRELMRRHPLATLFVPDVQGGQAHLLPLELIGEGPLGVLRGHVSRRHSLCDAPVDGADVLLVFQGPNAYISPRWYVNGQRSGQVAPSWNFVAVQARGRLRWVDDRAWLRAHLGALTYAQESPRDQPWGLADAAPEFVDSMAEHLIGFEIALSDLQGKRFLSQQRTPADRQSLVAHLQAEDSGMARDVAGLIVP